MQEWVKRQALLFGAAALRLTKQFLIVAAVGMLTALALVEWPTPLSSEARTYVLGGVMLVAALVAEVRQWRQRARQG
jgi:membrane-associated PAP2 superfamily phosphatase